MTVRREHDKPLVPTLSAGESVAAAGLREFLTVAAPAGPLQCRRHCGVSQALHLS